MDSNTLKENMLEKDLLSLLPPSLKATTRNEIREYFKNSWNLYELLFDAIQMDSTYYLNPDPLRNPLIFYYGHTAVFYVNKLLISNAIPQGLNEEFEILFAKGVDPELPQDLNFSNIWPSVDEVRKYRDEVYHLVLDYIDQIEIPLLIGQDHSLWALYMSIEHDRVHFETSSVLIRQLDSELIKKPKGWHYAPSQGMNQSNEWMLIDADHVHLGKDKTSELFGWDNEYGSDDCYVNSFMVSKNMVSNSDYLSFVSSDAYNNPKYWSSDGLKWKNRTGTKHPKFWISTKNNNFRYRAMFDEIEMPLDWPVEVNKFEAQAYMNYLAQGYRFLTEREFQLIAKKESNRLETIREPETNINLQFGSPSPVGYFKSSNQVVNDLNGNVWDWLDDDFRPLDGFESHSWYQDFSEPYFDNDHSMLLGGCWATTGTGTSKFYRLWFRNYFYQHAGFRLVKDID